MFGVQLGGDSRITKVLTYWQQIIIRPSDSVMVLTHNQCEDGNNESIRERAEQLVSSDIQLITLLSLNNEDAPYYNHRNADFFTSFGIPVFAYTPNKFPDLKAVALTKHDISIWAGNNDIKL